MANDDHIARLKKGAAAWNAWRDRTPDIFDLDLGGAQLYRADLRGANLRGANLVEAYLVDAKLQGADLSETNLIEADLRGANLRGANLSGAELLEADLSGRFAGWELGQQSRGVDLREANLNWANLCKADLSSADLRGANLSQANLFEANLREADFSKANLRGANLERTAMVDTILSGADLTDCRIYGISAWNLKLEATKQQNLIVTERDEPKITVDNIEVGQFVYLLLRNDKIRHVIDTITSKIVLILGSFTSECKAVLDDLREELRRRDYLPILFDFDKPASRDITETISLLARLARFVLADITDAKSIPQELMSSCRICRPFLYSLFYTRKAVSMACSNTTDAIPGSCLSIVMRQGINSSPSSASK